MFSIYNPQRADFSGLPDAITGSQERKATLCCPPKESIC